MTHVITTICIRDGACVEVCPVECIVPGPRGNQEWKYFYIDPDTCIDCGACVPVCPPAAIFPEDDLPVEYVADTKMNLDYFKKGPGYWTFNLEEQKGE